MKKKIVLLFIFLISIFLGIDYINANDLIISWHNWYELITDLTISGTKQKYRTLSKIIKTKNLDAIKTIENLLYTEGCESL